MSRYYGLLLVKTLSFNISEYNVALVASCTCNFGSYLLRDPKIPQLSRTYFRTGTFPSTQRTWTFRASCASRLDNASQLGNSRRFWCKQEYSLLTVALFSSKRFRSRSCGSFCSPARRFDCWSFSRKSIYNSDFSDTFAHLQDNVFLQIRMSLVCWCHHLGKIIEAHEMFHVCFSIRFTANTFYRAATFCFILSNAILRWLVPRLLAAFETIADHFRWSTSSIEIAITLSLACIWLLEVL